MLTDLRLALRQLAKARGFTLIAAVTLGGDILRLVFGQGLRWVALGLLLGLVARSP